MAIDDILKEFLIETYENLSQLDACLIELESKPSDPALLAQAFRTIHTTKGSAGFLALPRLESIAHVGEDLLSMMRDGALRLNADITSGLLAMVDVIRGILGDLESTGKESLKDDSQLIARLKQLAKSQEHKPIGEILVEKGVLDANALAEALRKQIEGDPRHTGEILVESGDVKPKDVVQALKTQEEQKRSTKSVAENNIRVDVEQLDKLMNLVGELVLTRNQVLQFTRQQENTAFAGAAQRLNLITSELQERMIKTRMQSIGQVVNQFPRVVRDLCVALGKKVEVVLEGRETEMDKTVLEAIKDPLTHVVRNAVDHGIEMPARRQETGKPPSGTLRINAFHEGGQVNIEISDDGGGIDVQRVKDKALSMNLISRVEVDRMSERELLNLIFLPGLSTAQKVTSVSGRGVGMDVVKTNIEKIGGTIDLQTKLGLGTTIRIKIPLTLAIIPALIVSSGQSRFAIPQINLLELVRIEAGEASKSIEEVQGAPVYRLRGNLLPLVYLNKELQLDEEGMDLSGAVNLVVLQADGQVFGLVVHEVSDTQEIVVKPFGPELKGLDLFAGATIMGDGSVALIIDALGLALRAGVISESGAAKKDKAVEMVQAVAGDRQTLLIFQSQDDGRMALPLSSVARLEEFPAASVERTGEQEVVKYRGQILHLVHVFSLVKERRKQLRNARVSMEKPANQETLSVVVYQDEHRSVGLVVGRIVDIVEENLVQTGASGREGVLFSAVVQERITEILDVKKILQLADPGYFAETETNHRG